MSRLEETAQQPKKCQMALSGNNDFDEILIIRRRCAKIK